MTIVKSAADRGMTPHPSVAKIAGLLVCLLAVPFAGAQGTAPPSPAPQISYANGQLTIHTADLTLIEILAKVKTVTGVAIELPGGAGAEKLPVVELGPGPARQVLASLLSDSGLDYVIQASDQDAEKIKSVLVMAREKRGSAPTQTELAAARRSPYSRGARPEPAPEPEPPPAPAQPEIATAEVQPPPPAPPSVQPDAPVPNTPLTAQQAIQIQQAQTDQSGGLRPGALPTPTNLSQEGIAQQLQQMYQQRMQMNQPAQPATGK